jgi:hypothetical protein
MLLIDMAIVLLIQVLGVCATVMLAVYYRLWFRAVTSFLT